MHFAVSALSGTPPAVPSLTVEDLKDLGVSIVGHRRKVLDATVALRADEKDPLRRTRPSNHPPMMQSSVARSRSCFNPETAPYYPVFLREFGAAGSPLAAEVSVSAVRNEAEIEMATTAFAHEPTGGLIARMCGSPVSSARAKNSVAKFRCGADFISMGAQVILSILLSGILLYAWTEFRRSPAVSMLPWS
jgi:hypothetical protein